MTAVVLSFKRPDMSGPVGRLKAAVEHGQAVCRACKAEDVPAALAELTAAQEEVAAYFSNTADPEGRYKFEASIVALQTALDMSDAIDRTIWALQKVETLQKREALQKRKPAKVIKLGPYLRRRARRAKKAGAT